MPPEEPSGLVALWLEVEGHSLTCRGERVFPKRDPLKVSWYTAVNVPPEGYKAVLDGVVFVYEDSVSRITKIDRFRPTRVGDQWQWRDHAGPYGLMLVLVLPPHHALVAWNPPLVEAKRFLHRVAVFWLLYSESQTQTDVLASWSITASPDTSDVQVESLNRAFALARKRERPTDYDVALSFAGEDRTYVEEVARTLTAAGVKVFYDKLEEARMPHV